MLSKLASALLVSLAASAPVPAIPAASMSHMALPRAVQDVIQSGGFAAAFTQSFLLILACEMGDRTFFVAAVLAMKSSRIVVWSGALAALGAMTVVSALLGKAFPLLFRSKQVTSMLAAALFAFFGLQLLRDWWRMRGEEASENEELAEVEQDVKKQRLAGAGFALLSPVFVKSFTMTGLAEWGDRSQIATIALAASKDVYGVIIGGILGHAVCTSLAVIGGRLLATRISERLVALIGGIMFLSFALITASGKLD